MVLCCYSPHMPKPTCPNIRMWWWVFYCFMPS
jgi:hypothetical protein